MKHFNRFIVYRLGILVLPCLFVGCPTMGDPAAGSLESAVESAGTASESEDSASARSGSDHSGSSGDSGASGEVGDSAELSALLDRVERTLEDNLKQRRLSTELNGAWQILHGVLAYGTEFTVETPDGVRPTIEYLLDGGRVRGFDPIVGDPLGDPPRPGLRTELEPSTKIGQGHRDQWLAVLAQAGLGPDTAIRTDDHEFVIEDWVRQIEHDIPRNLELEFSWTLIGLLAYRPTDHRWRARDGNEYNIEVLLESEIEQSLPSSACGGTHRLIGIAMALDRRRGEGKVITGPWERGERLIADSIAQARRNQNPDGSYSVAFHHRTGWTRDLGETLSTTGHVLEFLSLAASAETLREPWVRRSAEHLCDVLEQCRDIDLECGALYHALHGLQVYRQRLRPRSYACG